MLKLSSNYAKSYLRDNPSQDSQRSKPANTERFYPNPTDYEYEAPKRVAQDTDFRREKYDYKQVNNSSELRNDYTASTDLRGNKEKTYGYSYQNPPSYRNEEPAHRQDYGEYQRKNRNYEEPLNDIESNYRDISPKTVNPKRNNFTPAYDFDFPSQNDQNYQPDVKSYRYSKYSGRATPVESTFALEKKQFPGKHNRRNEQVKSRLYNQQSYGARDTKNPYEDKQLPYDNYLNEPSPSYDKYRNQQECREGRQDYSNPSTYKNSRRLQFQTFEKLDDRKTQRQSKNSYDQTSPKPQYSQELQLTKQKSDDYTVGFDRPYLNERKEAIKKSIENTPQKSYKGGKFEPGSAERKNSLIEKSQMLQEKLKKLNMQFPVGGQRQRQKEVNNCEQSYQPNRQISRNQPSQQNDEIYSKYAPSARVQDSPIPNRSSSCLRNSFRNVNISQGESITAASRNADILRAKSPILEQQNGMELPTKGQAIEKITKLNEKINERIQSIISNYAKK